MAGETSAATVRASVDLALPPQAAFEVIVDELSDALGRLGMHFEPGADGHVTQGDHPVGRVTAWQSGSVARLAWHPADWQPDEVTELELRVEARDGGSRATVEQRGWGRLLADSEGDLAGWFAGQVAAPLLQVTAPRGFGDWLTDRRARRPSGERAEATYRDPRYHRPNFLALLDALALNGSDFLLEVGCGGGAFLHDALRSGCRAAAVDHSPEMVRLAREVNQGAVAERRLEVIEASATELPFQNAMFTGAVMTGVFGFLDDPLAALNEIRRVLAVGGRVAIFTSSEELRGSPATPEPVASRIRFYTDDQLAGLARQAGFEEVQVDRPNLRMYAERAGLTEAELPLFEGRAGQLLVARRY